MNSKSSSSQSGEWATILQTEIKNPFLSRIRRKIALVFLLTFGIVFLIILSIASSIISNYLLEQQIYADYSRLDLISNSIMPLYHDGLTEEIEDILLSNCGESEKLYVIDCKGNVQFSNDIAAVGSPLLCAEVTNLLSRGQKNSFSYYDQSGNSFTNIEILRFPFFQETISRRFSISLISQSEIVGVLLLDSPAPLLTDTLGKIQKEMLVVFFSGLLVSLLFSIMFTRMLTTPISGMMRGLQKMSRGDFDVTIPVRGSKDMKELATSFNLLVEKLKNLEKNRSEFVSNASHELKTPMTSMKALLETLIYNPEMEKDLQLEFMQSMDAEIDRLTCIVNDLLSLVKMDVSEIHLNRENFSLESLIKENVHRLEILAKRKNQTIQLSISDSCDIFADRSKLNQVIYNLMENAIKYTQDGGTITVDLVRQRREAEIYVRDNGPGIAEEHIPYIFDRFYRVDKARSRESGGNGLGLSIVYHFVKLHSGTVRVESELKKGTTFIVELPLHQG